jgi:hypothetical protein
MATMGVFGDRTNKIEQIRLKDPDKEWELTNAWFVRQKNMDVYLTRRGGRV